MAQANITSDKWVLDADLEGQKQEQSIRKKGWRSTMALTYSAIGVVYGDVGTSPLYVFSSTFTENVPTETDVLGAMSIIFWTITLIVVVKYMLIVLLADDNGEGGTFALYSLICRFAGMRPANNGVPDASDVTLSHYSRHSGDKNSKSLSRQISFKLKQYLATTVGAQASLLCLVLLMTSMVLGDGVLTPAQSVLGAIYGLQVKTSVSQGAIVGISCAIVVLLFMVQRFGTGRVGVFFAPVILIYFLCNVIIAITNITRYKPSVFKALSPHYGYYYFRNNHHLGWVQCSGLFLAITDKFSGSVLPSTDIDVPGASSLVDCVPGASGLYLLRLYPIRQWLLLVCVCVCHCGGMCGQSGNDQCSLLHHQAVHCSGLLPSTNCAACL